MTLADLDSVTLDQEDQRYSNSYLLHYVTTLYEAILSACLCVLQGDQGDKGRPGAQGSRGDCGQKGEPGEKGLPGEPVSKPSSPQFIFLQ